MSDLNPACADCHIRRRKAGCGYLAARTRCQHWEHRDEWAAAEGLRKSRNVTGSVTSDDYAKYGGIGTGAGLGDTEGECLVLCAESDAGGNDLLMKQERKESDGISQVS